MVEAPYRPISNLKNAVRNRTHNVEFGSLVDRGWFSASPGDLGVRRSIRTNNPGALNIRPWQQKLDGYAGYTPPDNEGNQTTIYQTPECGVAAWYHLLAKLYGFEDAGRFSLTDLARKYAGRDASEKKSAVTLLGGSISPTDS